MNRVLRDKRQSSHQLWRRCFGLEEYQRGSKRKSPFRLMLERPGSEVRHIWMNRFTSF
jgi:hypothetical protein